MSKESNSAIDKRFYENYSLEIVDKNIDLEEK
jgi:hypothetical protein